MTREEAISLIENEIQCVLTHEKCDRDCEHCLLVKPEEDILKAFRIAIEALSDVSVKKDRLIEMIRYSSQYNSPCPEWVYKLIEATAYDD